MNNKKRKSKILGLFACLALSCVGLGVGTAIAQPEVKTASALTYTTAKCLTYGSTNNGSSTSDGCPSNFKIYMYGASTSGEGTIYQDHLSNWSYYYIYIDAIKVSDHRSFRLLRNGYEYATTSVSGSSDRVLYEGSLPDGEYELEYTCRYAKNIFYDYTYYTYTYRFEVDKTSPTNSLKAGGSSISSGTYTNKKITFTGNDKNFYYIRYKRPTSSSYSYYYGSTYSVPETTGNNGWWYFYGCDDLIQSSSTVSVYYDTVIPVGTVKTSGGTTLASGAYTNQSIKYSATDTGGIYQLQYKKPGATSWATYTANTLVSGTGWHTFRAVDKAGNISAETTVYYDAISPTGTLYGGTSVKSSGSYTNAEYVKYVASDSASGISACYVKMPNSSYFTSYTSGSQLTAEGTYQFYCLDKSQNQSSTVSITLDKTKPTGTLYAGTSVVASGSSTNAAYIKFIPYDAIGVKSIYVKKPGASTYVSYTSGTQFTTEGTYSFYCQDSVNTSDTYTITLDRQIPSAQLYVDEQPVDNNSYTNGGHIKFECEETCYVMLPDTDIFVAYSSGAEFYKPGKYVFYGVSVAGNNTGLYTLIIDRTIKPLTFTNVQDGYTLGDVELVWEDGDPNVYAPVASITINGKPFAFGDTLHTVDSGSYEIVCTDAAGNVWTDSFVSKKDNIVTETVSKQYYEAFDVNGDYYAFSTYEKAFEFACAYERSFIQTGEWNGETWDTGFAMDGKDSANAVNGTYFVYKKDGNADENVAYFTEERLNEVIAQYAKEHVKAYYYWQKSPANKVEGESLDNYVGENKIVASSITLGENIKHLLNGEEFDGNVIETAGFHTLTIMDDWGNSYDYEIVIVRELPIIQYAVGANTPNVAAFDRTYLFKDQVSISLVDEYDELAMFTVFDKNGEVIGYFNVDDICTIEESGTYTVKAVNHFGETEVFTMIISRDAPKIAIEENTEGKKLEITVTKSVDKESSLQTLEIFKSVDNGETWELLERDDYGRLITTERLEYAFRTTAMYKIVVTDEFRTGIDAVTAQASYEQKLPEGELIGVENGGFTNGAVSFEWTDEATVVLTKDGEAITYISGHKLTVDGNYVLTFENFDGYKATYTFTIDTEAPEVTMEGASHREAVNEDVKVFYTEENLTAELYKDGKMLGYYVSGNPISADGQYRVRIYDVAGNEVSVEFSIDKTVEYDINVYDKGLSNSVVATSHEILTTELTKDGEKVDYALGSAITAIGDYTLVLTDALGNNEVITFRIINPLVQEFTHNFDDIEGFGGVLVNGADKRLNYGTLELFEDGNYEVGVIVGGKTYNFAVTVDNTAPTLTLNGVENGGGTKESVTLSDLSEKATMKVYLNDTEIKYELGAELTELGKYRVVLTDEAGNVAEYEFEILYKMNGGAIALIIIGVLAILGIILAIFLGKRATYKKKVAQETDEDDDDDFEDENSDDNGTETDTSEEGETP